MRSPTRRLRRGATAALLFALPLVCPAPPTEAAPVGPQVVLRRLDAPPLSGKLVALEDATLQLETTVGRSPQTVDLMDVIAVRFPATDQPGPTDDGRILRAHLAGGDVIAGRFVGPSADGIRVAVLGVGTLDLSFDVILTLELLAADAGPCERPGDRQPRPESGDIAYDVRGDEYRGTVMEATAESLEMRSARGRRRKISWDRLHVLHLQNDALEAAAGLQAELELTDGSRIALAGTPRLAAGGFEATSRSLPGTRLKIPFANARAMRWWGGRFVYATTLPFRNVLKPLYADPPGTMEPELREPWFGLRVDRRTSGCPLRLGGVTYRRGFGVNSHSTIEIPLGGAYRTFRAMFGIDDEVLEEARGGRSRGDVDARVLGDGRVLWEAKGVQGGQNPRRVGPLDVSGVQTLVLEVGFGKDLMTLDRADWVDPILERR